MGNTRIARPPRPTAPKSTGVKRLHRLLRLIYLMQRGPAGAAELMTQLDVSRATFFRCLEQLGRAGIPYFYDADAGGYRIRGDWFLPPLQFTFDEVLAVLALAPREPKAMAGHPACEALHAGLLKLINALPGPLRTELQELLPRIQHPATPLALPGDRDFYSAAANALRYRRVVKARYYSVREDVEFDTELRLYAVFFHKHSWYGMGHSDRDGGTRTFKLSRFLEFRPTMKRYRIPEKFALSGALEYSWGVITDGPGHDVSIRFTGRGAHYVRETLWHPHQRITELPNRECRLEVFVNGFDELVPWILSWGPLAFVEGPLALQEAVKNELKHTYAQYEKTCINETRDVTGCFLRKGGGNEGNTGNSGCHSETQTRPDPTD